jgi:hypothetical protein
VPDLAAALTLAPTLRVLSISGYHDLATPFRQTELDLARIADPAQRRDSRLSRRAHDVSRRRLATADQATTSRRGSRAGDGGDDARRVRRRARARAAPGRRARRRRRSAPPRAPMPRRRLASPADLVQAGDPYVPPALRVAPPSARPKARRSKALVERKIAERRADPWR